MSYDERVADRLQGIPSERLRYYRGNARTARSQAVIDLVLTQRLAAFHRGFDSAQVLLDVIGCQDVGALLTRATDAAKRQADASDHLAAEQSYGVAAALAEYLTNCSDV